MYIKRSIEIVLYLVSALLFQVSAVMAEEEKVVAVVNGDKITETMLQAYTQSRKWELSDVSSPEARERLINEMIDERLLTEDALRLGLEDDPETALRLKLGRKEILATAAVRNFLKEQGPSEEAIREEYEKTASAMAPKEYLVRHIQVDSKSLAEELIQKLENGADFDELAAKHSTSDSAQWGGDLGWLTPNVFERYLGITPHFHGQIDEENPILLPEPGKNSYGWQVVRIDDIRQGKAPSFEGAREMIVRILENRAYRNYLKQLKAQAEIENRFGD